MQRQPELLINIAGNRRRGRCLWRAAWTWAMSRQPAALRQTWCARVLDLHDPTLRPHPCLSS